MDDVSCAWEKLHIAVGCLAAGSGTLRERLLDAYMPSLSLIRPEQEIPWPALRQRFVGLMEDLAPGGDVKAALAGWSEENLRRIAIDLVGIYDHVTRHMEVLELD
jgi:hypothetical protein